jgi:hypothetical protein
VETTHFLEAEKGRGHRLCDDGLNPILSSASSHTQREADEEDQIYYATHFPQGQEKNLYLVERIWLRKARKESKNQGLAGAFRRGKTGYSGDGGAVLALGVTEEALKQSLLERKSTMSREKAKTAVEAFLKAKKK